MKKRIAILSIIAVSILLMASTIWGSNNQPGSAGDPVVTRSYVDNQINQLRELISGTNGGSLSSQARDEIVSEVLNQVAQLSGATYVPVQAFEGDVIVGLEGTEIILRSGSAVAVVPGGNGITNVTTGRELLNNAAVERDNLLIIPRHDGRGVRVTAEEAWFLIKGGYEVN
ncbi:MAG: hypothetical protein FWE29_06810 [Defluviitaleaceae bacterium]|nr:hypothetical protein [Defluviitaleaceae bacterium]